MRTALSFRSHAATAGRTWSGAEQGPALGLMRTQELLAARRIDGGEQFFTRARDFGYSKSPDETLRIWGKDEVLADMVAVIRRFRPDVIITRFSPEPGDTHGHHTASAILAVEAFRAAADPKFHPEQLTGGVALWQARRLLWNRSSWGLKPDDDLSGLLKLDVGGYSPLLGASFGEMAADSRSMHKSQGFGVARSRGPTVEYFQVLTAAEDGGAPDESRAGENDRPVRRGRPLLEAPAGAAPVAALMRGRVARSIRRPRRLLPALAAVDAGARQG